MIIKGILKYRQVSSTALDIHPGQVAVGKRKFHFNFLHNNFIPAYTFEIDAIYTGR